jgi:hypothetical protein
MAGKGHGADGALQLMLGYTEHLLLECHVNNANGYVEVSSISADWLKFDQDKGSKGISADTEGVVRVTYESDFDGSDKTEVMKLNAGSIRPCRNVKRLWYYYNPRTAAVGTAGAYAEDGSLYTPGIKLHR